MYGDWNIFSRTFGYFSLKLAGLNAAVIAVLIGWAYASAGGNGSGGPAIATGTIAFVAGTVVALGSLCGMISAGLGIATALSQRDSAAWLNYFAMAIHLATLGWLGWSAVGG